MGMAFTGVGVREERDENRGCGYWGEGRGVRGGNAWFAVALT